MKLDAELLRFQKTLVERDPFGGGKLAFECRFEGFAGVLFEVLEWVLHEAY